MPTPQELLGHIPPGRVLDVATGTGGFIHFLLEGLPGYSEIIGIDSSPRGEAAFADAFNGKTGIRFVLMDALHLTFESGSFDLVCIANSLHHFDDPLPVLEEMLRVLRPGGHFLIQEMYRDHQAETQLTHVELHHWWAAVDRACGVVHHETYLREALVKLIEALGLSETRFYDLYDTSDDPRAAELLDQLNPVIDRYIQRAEGHTELQAQGERLRQRLKDIGVHGAASLLMMGEKDD
jgi:ubiquinone/menaquinone biosynthesis C-methylase UbiE